MAPSVRFWTWEFTLVVVIVVYFGAYCFLQPTHDFSSCLKHVPITAITSVVPTKSEKPTAYVQYATTLTHVDLALNNFNVLRKSNTTVDSLVLLYADVLAEDIHNQYLHQANACNVTLKPVELFRSKSDSSNWQDSFTKLHVFNETDYSRVIFFDADSMLVNVSDAMENRPGNMDSLLSVPDVDIALPRAYWITLEANEKYPTELNEEYQEVKELNGDSARIRSVPVFATHVMVIKPSTEMFEQLVEYVYNPWYWKFWYRDRLRRLLDYDMEIINKIISHKLLESSIKVATLPHEYFGVLTGEFHESDHSKFLTRKWDPHRVLKEAKLLHFSDAPLEKPWIDPETEAMEEKGDKSHEVWVWTRRQFLDVYRNVKS